MPFPPIPARLRGRRFYIFPPLTPFLAGLCGLYPPLIAGQFRLLLVRRRYAHSLMTRGFEDGFHVFLSYTSRENEVAALQLLVDAYCRNLWNWANSRGVHYLL